MATRNVAQTVCFLAWDTAANTGKTGDGANFTMRWVKDGTSSALTTTTVTEIDSTNCPGLYKVGISATEADCNVGFLMGKSSTASIKLMPVKLEFERLPDAVPDAAGGVRDTARFGGTTVTGRDLGVSVLVGDKTGFALTAAYDPAKTAAQPGDAMALTAGERTTLAASIWNALTSGMSTVGSIGKRIVDYLTGDAFARIGAAGAGLSALGDTRLANLDAAVSSRASDADMATLLARLTSTRAALLDNLNVGGLVASSAEATAVQNNTRVVRVVPATIERPDSGSITIPIELLLYDSVGNMEAPDSAPTLVVLASDGTDLSARLDSGTMALVATGRYRAVLTVAVGDTLDALRFVFSVVEGGATRVYVNASWIVDTTAVDFTASDRSDLQSAKASAAAVQAKLPSGGAAIGDATEATVTARSLASASYATASALATLQAAIDAMNNLSAAQAQSAAAAALAAYDPPTRAEATSDKDAVIAALPAAPDNAAIVAVKVWTDRLGTAMELDGAVYRFTANALEQAPAGGGGGGGATMTTAVPTTPDAGSMGEALAAALHWRLGKRVLTDNGDGTYTLRTYRAHATECTTDTLWHTETLNHPTAPSTVTPA